MSENKKDHLDFEIEDVNFDVEEKKKAPAKKTLDIPVIEKRQRRMESEPNLAPHHDDGPTFLEAYGRYLLIGAIAVVLIVVLIWVGSKLFNTAGTGTGESGTEEGTNTTTEAPEESTQAPLDTSLQLCDDPEVAALMNAYYKANLNCDLVTIFSLVEDDSQFTLDSLQKKREYIEDYLNITCYTKPGVNEDEYILYVYSEIKFANIATAAPQLNRYYLNRSAEGKLVLANGVLASEKVEHMTKMDDSEDVLQLVESVYNRLTDAMESDEKLYNLVQLLNGVVDSESTGAADETEDPTGTTFYVNGELFYRTDEYVYVKEVTSQVTIFASNSKESEVLGTLYFGDYVVRTGYSDEWSQIEYRGKTAYVYKGQLTTEQP